MLSTLTMAFGAGTVVAGLAISLFAVGTPETGELIFVAGMFMLLLGFVLDVRGRK